MQLPNSEDFLSDIEEFLIMCNYPHTAFSKDVMNNVAFVAHLREGRGVTLETARKCYEFMDRVKLEIDD